MEFISQLQPPITQDEIDFQRIADRIIADDWHRIILLLNILAASLRQETVANNLDGVNISFRNGCYSKILSLSSTLQAYLPSEKIKCPIRESLQSTKDPLQ